MGETQVEHVHDSANDSGMGFFFGILVLIIFFFLLLYFGIPRLKSLQMPQIKIPDKIDVNVHQQK